MREGRIIRIISIAILIVGLGAEALSADELKVPTSMAVQMAQGKTPASPAAESPKAKSTLLMEKKLDGLPGFKVQIVLVEGPPGWVGGRHYHPGYLFGYVLEGSYLFNFDDLTKKTVKAGEAFSETPNTIMRSKNGSSTEWVRDVVFQILREDQPPAISVE